MQLKDDLDSFNLVSRTVDDYYYKKNRNTFKMYSNDEIGKNIIKFIYLVDRKFLLSIGVAGELKPDDYVIYRTFIGMGFGEYFVPPAIFWSEKAQNRFSFVPTTKAIVHNLKLMDEFWYGNKKKCWFAL